MSSCVQKKVDIRKHIFSLLGRWKEHHVVKHFQEKGVPQRTIYRIIKRFKSGLPCEDQSRNGRPTKLSKKQRQKLKNSAENGVGTSQRKLALKFNVSKTCIQENLKKLDLKYYKRQPAPKYNQKQLEQMPSKCRKLPFVPKYVNPPNVPKARPIEDFWGILAQQAYSGGWTVRNQDHLVNRIKTIEKN